MSQARHPRLGGLVLSSPAEVADRSQSWPVRSRVVEHRGQVLSLRRDEVVGPDGSRFSREAVTHPGAVGVVAVDEQERMLLVRQYRHPVGQRLVQAPAGLLDVDGEPPAAAAARELAEEAGVAAASWQVLADYLSSPGFSTEAVRIYLARDLAPATDPVPAAEHEEADLDVVWAPVDWVVAQALAGRVRDALLLIGALGYVAARRADVALRPVNAAWPDAVQV